MGNKMSNLKKYLNSYALAIFALSLMHTQAAMAWPTRSVQMLVGFPAGGSVDVLARAFGEALSVRMGQSVVVQNRDGASGTIGMAAGAKAEDGHTIVFGPAGPLVLQPHIKANLPYKLNDMVGICQTFVNNYALVTSPNSKYRNLRDVLNDPDAKGDGVTYGSGGMGTMPHIGAVMFSLQSGAAMRAVQYRGDPPLVLALKSGDLQLASLSVGAAQKQGFRILGVFTSSRLSDAPDAPTMTEQGIPVVARVFGGLYVPKSMPAQAIKVLKDACEDAVKSERYVNASRASQQEILYRDSDAFSNALATEFDSLGQFLRKANLKLD
jgi:tripartite-type tricarboxylate transporter receptor subunit TctC